MFGIDNDLVCESKEAGGFKEIKELHCRKGSFREDKGWWGKCC